MARDPLHGSAGWLHQDALGFGGATRTVGRPVTSMKLPAASANRTFAICGVSSSTRSGEDIRLFCAIRGAAAAERGVGEQNGVRSGFEIGRDLHRDALLRAAQQCIRQAEDAGADQRDRHDRDLQAEPDDQADTAQRQADLQQRVAPPRPLGQRIDVDIDNVSAICRGGTCASCFVLVQLWHNDKKANAIKRSMQRGAIHGRR